MLKLNLTLDEVLEAKLKTILRKQKIKNGEEFIKTIIEREYEKNKK